MNRVTWQRPIVPVTWAATGLVAMLGVSLLSLTAYAMTPIWPMPIHLYLGYWTIGPATFFLIPFIYVIHVGLVFVQCAGARYFSRVSGFLLFLSIVYLLASASAGLKWQGELYVAVVVAENVVGFGFIFWLLKNQAGQWRLYAANFILFFMLMWCAFPTLGEVP